MSRIAFQACNIYTSALWQRRIIFNWYAVCEYRY